MFVLLTQNFPPDTGGIAALMGGLAQALAAEGPVHALAHRIRTPGRGEWAGHPCAALRRFGAPQPLRNWLKRAALRPLLRAPGLRGIICDSWKSAEVFPMGALPAPVLVLAHGMEFPPEPSPAKARRLRAALARASVVVANSRHTAAQAAPFLAPGARIEVIPPPIPPQPEADAAARAALRDIAGPGPIIAGLGRLEPRKGFDRVIAALPALSRAHPDLRFVLAGEGADRVRLEALAQEHGVADRLLLLGGVDEARKAALLAEADLFAMPTRREGASVEGFGIVYLEAAWHGCPALAGTEGGAADAVAQRETGLLVDGASQEAVTAGLSLLLSDAGLRRAMGRAAAERVRREFLWPALLPRYLALMPPRG